MQYVSIKLFWLVCSTTYSLKFSTYLMITYMVRVFVFFLVFFSERVLNARCSYLTLHEAFSICFPFLLHIIYLPSLVKENIVIYPFITDFEFLSLWRYKTNLISTFLLIPFDLIAIVHMAFLMLLDSISAFFLVSWPVRFPSILFSDSLVFNFDIQPDIPEKTFNERKSGFYLPWPYLRFINFLYTSSVLGS